MKREDAFTPASCSGLRERSPDPNRTTMAIEGKIIRLRAVEPEDIDRMYRWENDSAVWPVSGTTEPFSREQMARFVERQLGGGDLLHTGQLRLIIETRPAGCDVNVPKQAAAGGGSAGFVNNSEGPDDGAARCGSTDMAVSEDGAAKNGGRAEECRASAAKGVFAGGVTGGNSDADGDAKTPQTPEAPEGCTAKGSVDAPRAVGAVDLFEYDPINRRAGIGILIYANDDRGRGYASDTLATLCRYLRDTLGLHQLWCNIGADNRASLQLFLSAGFTQIGIKRQWQWRPDGYHDEVMMQKILE